MRIMTNRDKYINAFVNAFSVKAEEVPTLRYQGIPDWDSVGHMNLIAEIEEAFDIMIDTDDIIDWNSFEKGVELLKKYDVEI